jgi:hypothetical protein
MGTIFPNFDEGALASDRTFNLQLLVNYRISYVSLAFIFHIPNGQLR